MRASGGKKPMKKSWLKGWLSGKPHFVIGGEADPYMFRWYIIPRNKFFNIYLHKFMRDDEDRALHDHPWWFVSLMIWGGYFEMVTPNEYGIDRLCRTTPSVAYRRATHRHSVVLFRDSHGNQRPCWTIVLTGRAKRTWGFWCPHGFVRWMDFVAQHDDGQIGRGCDQ
jgi:hypothetical protein